MAVGTLLLVLLISGPLLLVTKQVYITNVSIRMNAMSDSLENDKQGNHRASINMRKISSNERIEKFATKNTAA